MAEVADNTIVDGRYRILTPLGSGGMADVYRAEDTHLGREVALKILYRRFAQDDQFVERFKREAQAAAGLQHPHVVSIYDRGEHEDTYYIAMEYLSGRTLKETVASEGPLDQEWTIDLGIQILRAASFAHRRGIVHRDLKPQNVMVDEAGNAKVADFGIARAGASEMTEAGSIMGTAQYLSPEQAQGEPTTAASDLYSVGIILYELLTGQLPFDGETAVSIALQHLNDAPEPIHTLRGDVSPALEAAVMRALEKDPAQRYASADEFISALEAARPSLATQLLGQDTAVFEPVGATPASAGTAVIGPTGRPPFEDEPPPEEDEQRRRRWPWLAIGLGALLLTLGLLLLALGGEQRPVPSVTGEPLALASETLKDAGFEIDVERRPDRAAVDEVIDQDPDGGIKADEGSTIKLVVSSGPGEITIPTVEGFAERRAVQELTRAGCDQRDDTTLCGFRVEVKQQSSDEVDKGKAVRTSPASGTRAEVGSRILLYVSGGPKRVEVPDVIGLARESAQSTLDRAGLGFTVRQQESEQEPGTVIAQNPFPGDIVDKGSRVEITVAKPPERVEVPNVVGDSEGVARKKLEGQGFRVDVDTEPSDEPGIVLDQSPNAGQEREEGSKVTIIVGGEAEIPPDEEPGDGDEVELP